MVIELSQMSVASTTLVLPPSAFQNTFFCSELANVEYTGQSTKSKLAAGLNATVSQQGNEYTRVETGAGGAQFVAVGVKKRDRRSVEEIEAEMKREREGAGKDESGDANGDAKRAKTEGPAAE